MHSSLLRRFMVSLAGGLIAWAMTAYLPVVGPWALVIGLAVALVLWA